MYHEYMHSHDPHDYKVVQRDQMRKQKLIVNGRVKSVLLRKAEIVRLYEILVTNQLHFQFNVCEVAEV